MRKVPHWQMVENVAAAIEALAPGLPPDVEVVPKAKICMRSAPGVRREVDVLVTFTAGRRRIRVGIDVKNESEPLDITIVEGLYAKYRELDLDRYTVVSTSGFSAAAKEVYTLKGVELVTLEEVAELRWAGLSSFQVVRRKLENLATHLDIAPDHILAPWPPGPILLAEVVVTGLNAGATEQALPDYLAEQIGNAVPSDPGTPEAGWSEEFVVCLTIADNVQRVIGFRYRGLYHPVPHAITVRGRWLIETESCPVVKYRSESGEEVITTITELPGFSGGPQQLTMAAVGSVETGYSLSMVLRPALPKPTDIG